MTERAIEFTKDRGLFKTRMPVLDSGNVAEKRAEIRAYFHASYDLDEALYETLAHEETFFRRADPLRHPLIFYFGHTAVFYINKLIIAKLIDQRINPAFESMFAVGVDEMSWDDLDMAHYDWPSRAAVQAYRDSVRTKVDALIQTLPLTLPITWNHPFWAILMGIEHSRIHIETSSVLIRQLPLSEVRRHPLWEVCEKSGPAPDNVMVDVAGGTVRLGKSKGHRLYGWDNEFGAHEAIVAPFAASRFLVSNQDYLAFIQDSGYGQRRWWTDEGWAWRTYRESAYPLFWIPDGSTYRLRQMLQEGPMPWDWPVEVNQLEAKAYCNWMADRTGRPLRLPTEDEWVLLRDRHVVGDQPDWQTAPGNINLEHYASPCPVDQFAFGDFYDLIGNVWQWTETPISGFRGFEAHPYYDDFSTPTFDSQHNLIKGGSWISTGNEATRDARYAFRRHFYQHAGLRLVASDTPVVIGHDRTETDILLCEACEFEYGAACLGVPNYRQTLAERCIALSEGYPRLKALDLGCGVGRSTFELARAFTAVTGLDLSANVIRLGAAMQAQGHLSYQIREEGEITTTADRFLDAIGLAACKERVTFQQADASNLKPLYTGYDLILAAGVIDRTHNPRALLESLHMRLNSGGLLVLASAYDWQESATDHANWLGGFRKDGEPVFTLAALHAILGPALTPLGKPEDIPLVLRKTRRTYGYAMTQVTVWQKA